MEIFVNLPRRLLQVCGRRRIHYGNASCRSSSSCCSNSSTFTRSCKKLPFQISSFHPSPASSHFSRECQRSFSSSSSSRRAIKEDKSKESTSHEEEEDGHHKGKGSELEGQASQELSLRERSELALRKKQREKSDREGEVALTGKGSPWEESEKRRYEKDVPPKEEERHKYWKSRPERSVNKQLIRTDLFENLQDKSKETFLTALEVFMERDVHFRGHVEFIYAALQQMKNFGCHRDLDAYKRIIDIFPKGRMISTNMFQVEFMHYPKQQQCAIDVLEQMESLGVMPDTEIQQMLTNVFGSQSFPMRKAMRMMYWMPKFKNLSPWPLPEPMPDNALELAKLAIRQITSVDLTTKITIYDAGDLEDAYDQTWIVSGQSAEQQKLIESHPSDQPIYVEGAFRVWMQRVCINYFILRAEPRPRIDPKKDCDADDVSKLSTIFEENSVELAPLPTVHEQDDGVILGVCATGTSSRDSVVSWIRFLEEENKRLGRDISVLFTLRSPIGPTDDLEIPSFEDVEKQKVLLGSEKSPFSIGTGGGLGMDPNIPSLKQVGVWTESESVFPNWPHHHHKPESQSYKNFEINQRIVEELEMEGKLRSRPTKSISESENNEEFPRKGIE